MIAKHNKLKVTDTNPLLDTPRGGGGRFGAKLLMIVPRTGGLRLGDPLVIGLFAPGRGL